MHLLDISAYVFEGLTFAGARACNLIGNVLLFSFTPIPIFLFTIYTYYKIYHNPEKLKKISLILVIPTAVVFLIGLLNIFVPFAFSISADNHYAREYWFFFPFVINFLMYAFSFVLLGLNYKKMLRNERLPLVFFMIIPAIASIIKCFSADIPLIWIASSLSLMIAYVNLQSNLLATDYVTNLYNQRQFEKYFLTESKKKRSDMLFAGVMINVEDLPEINRSLGYQTGDKLLNYVGDILRNLCSNRFICRYADDKFVILLTTTSEYEIMNLIKNIQDSVININNQAKAEYTLKVACGYAIYDYLESKSLEEFVQTMDDSVNKVTSKFRMPII